MASKQRPRSLRPCAAVLGAAALALAPAAASGQVDGSPAGRAFAPVFEALVRGDLVRAGNSNMVSAGHGPDAAIIAADVDGDATRLCAPRRPIFRLCADNSSSAELDLPASGRVIAARLYLETSVRTGVGPLRAALDGPGPGLDGGAGLRQAVWDVTAYVAAGGRGTYTVADIVYERVGSNPPRASWAIVAAYELDPTVGGAAVAAEDQPRFAPRFVAWHDGFQYLDEGSLDVPIGDIPLVRGAATFAKGFHIVAGGHPGRRDNLLFDGQPLGNNNMPDDAPPPAGVRLGTDAACNTVTDVQNDSICVLGSEASSGSGVDMDVIRIPDRYLRGAGSQAIVQVRAAGGETLAPGMIAVSVDVPAGGGG
jgi:hypothetical protein